MEISSNLINYRDTKYNCAFGRDITDRKQAETECGKLESQLHQSQKLEAIGTLAGGIVAHDFNNILSIIFGYTAHAMLETGGILAISLGEVALGAEEYPYAGLKAGMYLRLEVSDTGCGIVPEIKEKIFEPYFTAKKQGEGTGLGLATVHGIVKSLHGHISVYREPGKGTSMHVYLPKASQESLAQPETVPVVTAVSGHGERILFVDDEASIRGYVSRALQQFGYQVAVYADGEEAWQELEKGPDRYDLLVTDMTMPQMTGADLASKVLTLRPDLPVILCTGFSSLIDREKAMAIGVSDYLNKTLALQDLLVAIKKALNGKRGAV